MATSSPDVVDVLLGHHQQIKLLFGQLDTATGEHKQQLFAELVALLAVHENVEQLLVHPLAGRELPEGGAVVDARLAEEQDAKTALARLHDLGVDDPAFDQELFALRDAVNAHAAAEEELEFARLREVTEPQQLQRMAAAAAAALKLTPPARKQPRKSAAGNGLLEPPAAVFDRARAALQEAIDSQGEPQP